MNGIKNERDKLILDEMAIKKCWENILEICTTVKAECRTMISVNKINAKKNNAAFREQMLQKKPYMLSEAVWKWYGYIYRWNNWKKMLKVECNLPSEWWCNLFNVYVKTSSMSHIGRMPLFKYTKGKKRGGGIRGLVCKDVIPEYWNKRIWEIAGSKIIWSHFR